MDARVQIREERLMPLSNGEYATDRTWMPMNEEQLLRSIHWLFEEVRLSLIQESGTKLKMCGMSARLSDFRGTPSLLWTYRCNGVATDRTLKAEYLVYEMGKRANVLLEGDLTFRPVPDDE